MHDPGDISIADYNYRLPDELIAQFPLAERDASKLLVCKNGHISQDIFANISDHLPEGSLLVFNDTRVIRARLLFASPTGARIEIFCLEPLLPEPAIEKAFRLPSGVVWKCLVGNLKRWKGGQLVRESLNDGPGCRLLAEYKGDCGDGSHLVEFRWVPEQISFSEMLELSGQVPLPPYIHRETGPMDAERYQTIYALREGSVAAPTAGLHFTDKVLGRVAAKGIGTARLTLHVGVGTFRPVTAGRLSGHVMHHERMVVSRQTIRLLLDHLQRDIIAVGTTSARTLESLYWTGARLAKYGFGAPPGVLQWDPYREDGLGEIPTPVAMETLLKYMEFKGLDEYSGETQLMIVPGYSYRVISTLITNFHMPQSTLLLLVAALIGDDWKKAYDYAIAGNFRFLSYGDSCLFFNPVK